MDRHPLDIASLAMGLALFAVAVAVLATDVAGTDIDVRWVLPGVLLVLGAAGLAGSLRRLPHRRQDEGTPDGAP